MGRTYERCTSTPRHATSLPRDATRRSELKVSRCPFILPYPQGIYEVYYKATVDLVQVNRHNFVSIPVFPPFLAYV